MWSLRPTVTRLPEGHGGLRGMEGFPRWPSSPWKPARGFTGMRAHLGSVITLLLSFSLRTQAEPAMALCRTESWRLPLHVEVGRGETWGNVPREAAGDRGPEARPPLTALHRLSLEHWGSPSPFLGDGGDLGCQPRLLWVSHTPDL